MRIASPARVRKSVDLLSASGFQPSLVLKPTVCSPLRASSPRLFASLSTCSPTRVFDPRLFSNQRFDRKPTVCSPLRASSPRLFSNQRFDRKPSVCLAEVVCFASNPPPLRPPLRGSPLANLRFALRLGSSTLACSQTFGLLSASGFQPSLDGSPRLRAGSQTILKASFI